MELPKLFLDRMRELLNEDYDKYIESFNEENVRAISINENYQKADLFKKISPFPISQVPFSNNGFYLETKEKIGNHPYHHAGCFYVQDPAASIPVNSIDIDKSWKVLDLCAAPGGKTSQIAQKLTKGVLVSNEYEQNRAKILFSNVERQGFNNVIITNSSSYDLSRTLEGTFDLIIADVPCSGEGMFRKDPNAILEWSLDNIQKCQKRGLEIVKYADIMLKENGILLYSTCTYAKEENEDVVGMIISMGYEFIRPKHEVMLNTVKGINMEYARRFYPYISRGEGQFFAILRKKQPSKTSKLGEYKKRSPNIKIAEEFIKDTINQQLNLVEVGKYIYYLPYDFNVKAYSYGVIIGEVQKGRIIPHHQYFKAFGKDFKNKLALKIDDTRVQDYLVGLEITDLGMQNGFGVLELEGAILGGVKCVNGVLKNYYPKGLRIMR